VLAEELSEESKRHPTQLPAPEHLVGKWLSRWPSPAYAIRIGEAYGYRPEDIARYLIQNYTPKGKACMEGTSDTTGARWSDSALGLPQYGKVKAQWTPPT
jgi:hypothetical protein